MSYRIEDHIVFLSMQELLDRAEGGDSPLVEMNRSSRDKTRPHWHGTDSMETAVYLARYGWTEGLKTARQYIKRIRPKFDILIPKQSPSDDIKHDLTGGVVDIGRAIAGQPDCMIRYEPSYEHIQSGQVLQRIYFNTTYSSFINAQTLFIYGCVLVAMVETLELMGFRVELYTSTTIAHDKEEGSGALGVVARIKAFDEHIDIDRVCFCLANTSYLRRITFSILEQFSPELIKKYECHYGGSYSYPVNVPIMQDMGKDIYIPLITDNFPEEKIVQWGVDTINTRFKIRVEEEDNSHLKDNDENQSGVH